MTILDVSPSIIQKLIVGLSASANALLPFSVLIDLVYDRCPNPNSKL